MNLDNFVKKSYEQVDYKHRKGFEKFMFIFGKWLIVIAVPTQNFWWYKNWHTPALWLWIIFLITYLFCLFYCLCDVYMVYKFFKVLFTAYRKFKQKNK